MEPNTASATRATAPVALQDVYERMRFTPAHMRIVIAMFVIFVIESWEQLALVYVAGDVSNHFGLDETKLGLVLSAVAIGMIPGALIWGPIADRVGRRPVTIVSFIAYGVIAALVPLAPNFEALVGLRVLSGFALAGAYTVVFPYFLELMPSKQRGRAAVLLSIGWPIGTLVAIGVTTLFAEAGWQVVAFAAAVACLWVIVVAFWVPESPYFLVSRGKHDRAVQVLGKLGVALPAGTTFAQDADPERAGNPLELLRKDMRRRTLLMLIVNFAFNWGYWGLQVWLPTLLQERGLTLADSLGLVAISAVIMIPGYLAAAWCTKRFGRKVTFVTFLIGGLFVGDRGSTRLERAVGRSVQGVLPINTAGENAVLALASAAALGPALVDGDTCARRCRRGSRSSLCFMRSDSSLWRVSGSSKRLPGVQAVISRQSESELNSSRGLSSVVGLVGKFRLAAQTLSLRALRASQPQHQ